MMLYFEHTWHVIKTSHKSIKQDYKIWALEDLDYIFNWLWYSKILSTKNLDKKSHQNIITDTQTLVISLAKSLLNSAQDYILYLDNLFINDSLTKTLRQLDIEIMRTTQLKSLKLSLIITQLKHVKESLKWEYLKTIIVDNILYFLWQNNNWILSITTAYNLTDVIIRSRKRPSSTSTSAFIIRWWIMSLVGGTIYIANSICGMMTNLHVMCRAYTLWRWHKAYFRRFCMQRPAYSSRN